MTGDEFTAEGKNDDDGAVIKYCMGCGVPMGINVTKCTACGRDGQ